MVGDYCKSGIFAGKNILQFGLKRHFDGVLFRDILSIVYMAKNKIPPK